MLASNLTLPRTFPIRKVWRLWSFSFLFLTFFFFVLGIYIAFVCITYGFSDGENNFPNGIVIFFAIATDVLTFGASFIAVAAFIKINHICVTLYEEGLVYYGAGFRLFTPWTNMNSFTMILVAGRPVVGVQLRQKALINAHLDEGIRNRVAVIEADWWSSPRQLRRFAMTFPLLNVISPLSQETEENAIFWDYMREYAKMIFIEHA